MSHELSLLQKAIRWRQAGRGVSWICQQLERSRDWFYKWWNRYQAEGASGLQDRSRAPQSNPQHWSGEIRQAILDVRDRLMRHRGPRARYCLARAATIRHELACLGYDPLPSLRIVERVLQQGNRTSPAFRPDPCARSSSYPTIRLTHSNQRHHKDLIGPRYLKGSRRQYYFLVYRDVYDGAVFVVFQPKPRMDGVLTFVVRDWQQLGRPDNLQVDNSDLFRLTSHPGSLNHFFPNTNPGATEAWKTSTGGSLPARAHPRDSLAFCFSGSARTGSHDGGLFLRAYSSPAQLSDHCPNSKTSFAAPLASQFPPTPRAPAHPPSVA
jgi:hypothetical protein